MTTDTALRISKNGYTYVCPHVTDYSGKNPRYLCYITDEKFGTTEKGYVSGDVAKMIRAEWRKQGCPDYRRNRSIKYSNLKNMMQDCIRRRKSSTGGRRWDNTHDINSDWCYHGYTDESHWTGMKGSMIGHYIRYN